MVEVANGFELEGLSRDVVRALLQSLTLTAYVIRVSLRSSTPLLPTSTLF